MRGNSKRHLSITALILISSAALNTGCSVQSPASLNTSASVALGAWSDADTAGTSGGSAYGSCALIAGGNYGLVLVDEYLETIN